MTEDFLHFIWKYGLFDRSGLVTDTNEPVQVLKLGEHNTDAGPDFQNAQLRIGDTLWAGNIEIHLSSSDWYNHRHHTNKAYDNVILQVVYKHDQPARRTNNEIIPTVTLKFDDDLFENYCNLLNNKGSVPCRGILNQIDPFLVECWMNTLVVERLQQKTESIEQLLTQTKHNWEESFYIILARSFGFNTNAGPFELLARSLPLKYLAKHKSNLLQLEALLFGQAGFLNDNLVNDTYYQQLLREYNYLRQKYKIKPIEVHLWKFLRLRPVNFPTVRIAQFASLINRSAGLFSQIVACEKVEQLKRLFEIKTSDFWETHYSFEKSSAKRTKALGADSFQSVVINTIIPFLFMYGLLKSQDKLKERALEWLTQIPAEKNRIINQWESIGLKPASAYYSQALLQLSKNYCNRKRCLACSIGSRIITILS